MARSQAQTASHVSVQWCIVVKVLLCVCLETLTHQLSFILSNSEWSCTLLSTYICINQAAYFISYFITHATCHQKLESLNHPAPLPVHPASLLMPPSPLYSHRVGGSNGNGRRRLPCQVRISETGQRHVFGDALYEGRPRQASWRSAYGSGLPGKVLMRVTGGGVRYRKLIEDLYRRLALGAFHVAASQ